jgi:hypothetical protein
MEEIASNDAAIAGLEASGFIFWPVASGALGVNVEMIPDNIFT